MVDVLDSRYVPILYLLHMIYGDDVLGDPIS